MLLSTLTPLGWRRVALSRKGRGANCFPRRHRRGAAERDQAVRLHLRRAALARLSPGRGASRE